ncbi:primosomal protein N' [Aureivirga sp. CE67]|uniref:replication restart helicase PriA n=1 Tax=Aureivirga sp. CE67 TaxID=1788983 RepID=UPI0018CA372B|nr:primosomal protein N' [Aureivirga sp. CE67]
MKYINVILPISVQNLFTYRITEAEASFLKKGMRVAVPFGKSKIYTALVDEIHETAPTQYEVKDIFQILDEEPIVTEKQLLFWKWIAEYYMCTLGEVFRTAVPTAFILESETIIFKNQSFTEESILNDNEFLVFEALSNASQLTIQEISNIISKKNCLPIIKTLIKKEAIKVKEEIFEQYKPKLVKYVRLQEKWEDNEKLGELLETLSQRAHKQKEIVLTFFQLKLTGKPISAKTLQDKSGASSAILKTLVDKGVFEFYHIQTDRVSFQPEEKESIKQLTEPQEEAYQKIIESYKEKDITLFQGVTSSGKTEVYAKIIQRVIDAGKQVLYLVPEIGLTTQLIERLQLYFGDQMTVFHSKYSVNERVEAWNHVLNKTEKSKLVIGVRNAVFLPYDNLGLIIIDESHESSYKQSLKSPYFHGRDAGIVLAKLFQAKTLLGSATPSLESSHNVEQNKYGYVPLTTRYQNILLPEIELIDIKEKYRKKRMTGHFSDRLLKMMEEALEEKEQIIIFQNRRGYAPILECKTCGNIPNCPHCDVSLTFHKHRKELRCHYCNYVQAVPHNCAACGSSELDTKGFGTEQIEMELEKLFPDHKIGRMDADTTRKKYGFHNIISKFKAQEIDILVGTQMLVKGLDFDNVTLVGVLNADTMLNFPDFRAHEKSFQLLTQVAGRSGRFKKRGKVAIQTFNPYHQILQQVSTNSYNLMYKEQLHERWVFKYPPFYRVIKLTFKHRDYQKVEAGAKWFAQGLRNAFEQGNVLGPTIPSISRVRNEYIRTIIVKIPPKQGIKGTKKYIQKMKSTFQAVGEFRPIKFIVDVDAY